MHKYCLWCSICYTGNYPQNDITTAATATAETDIVKSLLCLPTSTTPNMFCKENPEKYYVCKSCECKRQAQFRKRSLNADNEPHCFVCQHDLTGGEVGKLFTIFTCIFWENYRFQRRKNGVWCAGKRQCRICGGYGCTATRHNSKGAQKKRRVVRVDLDASSSSEDDN